MVVAQSMEAEAVMRHHPTTPHRKRTEEEGSNVPVLREFNSTTRHFASVVIHDMKAVARYLSALQRMQIGEKEGYGMLERLANGKPLLLWEEEEEDQDDGPHLQFEERPASASSIVSQLAPPASFLIQQKKQFVLQAVEEALRVQKEGSGSPTPIRERLLEESSEEAVEAEALEMGETSPPNATRASSPNPTVVMDLKPFSHPHGEGEGGAAHPPLPSHRLFSDAPGSESRERWSEEVPERYSISSRERSTTAKPAESMDRPRDGSAASSMALLASVMRKSHPPLPPSSVSTTTATAMVKVASPTEAATPPSSPAHSSKREEDFDEPSLPFFGNAPTPTVVVPTTAAVEDGGEAVGVVGTTACPLLPSSMVAPPSTTVLDAATTDEAAGGPAAFAALVDASSASLSNAHSTASSTPSSSLPPRAAARSKSRDEWRPESRACPSQGLPNTPSLLPRLQQSFLHDVPTAAKDEEEKEEMEEVVDRESSSLQDMTSRPPLRAHPSTSTSSTSCLTPTIPERSAPPKMKGGDWLQQQRRTSEDRPLLPLSRSTSPSSLSMRSERGGEEGAVPAGGGEEVAPSPSTLVSAEMARDIKEEEEKGKAREEEARRASFSSPHDTPLDTVLPIGLPHEVAASSFSRPTTPAEFPGIGQRLPMPRSSSRRHSSSGRLSKGEEDGGSRWRGDGTHPSSSPCSHSLDPLDERGERRRSEEADFPPLPPAWGEEEGSRPEVARPAADAEEGGERWAAAPLRRRPGPTASPSHGLSLPSPATGNPFETTTTTPTSVSQPAAPLDTPASPTDRSGAGGEVSRPRAVPTLSMPASGEGHLSSSSPTARMNLRAAMRLSPHREGAGYTKPIAAPHRSPSSHPHRPFGSENDPKVDGTNDEDEKKNGSVPHPDGDKAVVDRTSPPRPATPVTEEATRRHTSSGSRGPTGPYATREPPHIDGSPSMHHTPENTTPHDASYSLNPAFLTISPIVGALEGDCSSSRLSIHAMQPADHGSEASSRNGRSSTNSRDTTPDEGKEVVGVAETTTAASAPLAARSFSPLLAKIRDRAQHRATNGRSSTGSSTQKSEGRPSDTAVPPVLLPPAGASGVSSGRTSDILGRRSFGESSRSSGRSSVNSSTQSTSSGRFASDAERKEKVAQLLERARAVRQK